MPFRIYRHDLASGARAVWKELHPPDEASVIGVEGVCVTPDGRSYAYSASRGLSSDLYVAEGLK